MSESITRARHLLQRSGFAETPARVIAAAEVPSATLLGARLDEPSPIAPLPPPDWVDGPILPLGTFRELGEERRRAVNRHLRQIHRRRIAELQGWWISNLVVTENPLGARMTLFWQNHFTSEARKVRYPELMYRQHATLMTHATGRFGDLLSAVLQDPAMLIYLDNRGSRHDRLNENLARELLELFTLGEGAYAEKDIRELARALSGLSLDAELAFAFRKGAHDPGVKTLLGVGGVRGLEDVVDVLTHHPATAWHLSAKLWRHFVSPEPDVERLRALSRTFRDSELDIRTLLEAMFDDAAFGDPAAHGTLVKSPIEYVVGTHRALALAPIDPPSLVRAVRTMQQRPYEPPNVRGWVGGERWINSATLLARRRFVHRILRSDALDLAALGEGLAPETLVAALLPLDPVEPLPKNAPARRARVATPGPRARAAASREAPIARLLRDPVYHLC